MANEIGIYQTAELFVRDVKTIGKHILTKGNCQETQLSQFLRQLNGEISND